MTKRTRRTLFYSFVGVFILFSIIAVLVALGYGYDFVNNKIVKTGALGLTSNVGVSVYINDKLDGQTSFLSNSFTKNRLIPGEYTVRLERKNYISWQKNVNIIGGVFIDFPSVVLLPDNPKTETLIDKLRPAPETPAIYRDWLFYINSKGFLSYINIRSNNLKPVKEFDGLDGIKISSNYKIIAFNNNDEIIIASGAAAYLLNLSNGAIKPLNNPPIKNSSNFYFRNSILYSLNNNQLVAYDTSNFTSKILLKKISSFAVSDNSLVYLGVNADNLHFYSLTDNSESNPIDLPAGVNKVIQFIKHNNVGYLVLQSASSSMLYKLDANNLSKLSNRVNKISLSPSQNKLLYYNDNQISVLYLGDTGKQPYFNSGRQELITRMSKTIYNPTWYKDEEHILVNIDDTVTLIEIDGRGERNSSKLYDSDNFEYDARLNAIYTVKNTSLLKVNVD